MLVRNFLLDTNVFINLIDNSIDNQVRDLWLSHKITLKEVSTSFITQIEVLGYNNSFEKDSYYRKFFSSISLIYLSSDIIDFAISLRKNYKIKLPDAIIAATAISNDLTLITSDKGFTKIENLNILVF